MRNRMKRRSIRAVRWGATLLAFSTVCGSLFGTPEASAWDRIFKTEEECSNKLYFLRGQPSTAYWAKNARCVWHSEGDGTWWIQ